MIEPCPICGAPYGFHEEDCGKDHPVPPGKLLPIKSEEKTERQKKKHEANQKYLNEQVKKNLNKLDGTPESAVSLLSGVSVEEFDEYGGLPKEVDDFLDNPETGVRRKHDK